MKSNRTQKSFGDAHAAAVESVFPSPTGRLRGQRPRLQKKPGYKKTPAPGFQLSAFIPSLPEVAGMVFLFRRLRLFFPPAIGSDPP